MIRTRWQWWDYATTKGTWGAQVFDILADWKEDQENLVNTLTEIRDTARTGLPTGGMTEEQWAKHRLNTIAGELTRLIEELQEPTT